jgi:hypothetical protein
MLCLILVIGGLLIMMGQHDRSEALFYYFRLEKESDRAAALASAQTEVRTRAVLPGRAAAQNLKRLVRFLSQPITPVLPATT